jgi:hypothetical protein
MLVINKYRMFHILDRPPFDDFTFKLFVDLFKNRKDYGLSNAEFIYTWSAYLSQENGRIKAKELFDPGRVRSVPDTITGLYFWKFGYDYIVGSDRYFNHVDDLYEHFKLTMADHPDYKPDLYHEFSKTYMQIHNSVQDKKQIEYKFHQIVKSANVVVLFVKDHFRVDIDQSWIQSTPEISEYYSNMCDYYSDKQFIIVTSLENLDKEIVKPNCIIVPMGGDITNQITKFEDYIPCSEKINSDNYTISLNRGTRHHRTYLVSLLHGLNLDNHVNISYLGMTDIPLTDEFESALKYDNTNDTNFNLVKTGFDRFRTIVKNYDAIEIYEKSTANDNIYNFNNSLRLKYKSTFLEFVTETSYNELAFNVTEKFSHSVFGYNLPIIISSPGYIEFMKIAGFDMFDDVINHSYDQELDKTARIYTAVTDNMELITNNKPKTLFDKHKSRFDENCNHLKNKLPLFYSNRFWNKLKEIKL